MISPFSDIILQNVMKHYAFCFPFCLSYFSTFVTYEMFSIYTMLFVVLHTLWKNVLLHVFPIWVFSWVCVYMLHAWCVPGEVWSTGTTVLDAWELPCRCWEPILCSLKGQQMFWTSESPSQPGSECSFKCSCYQCYEKRSVFKIGRFSFQCHKPNPGPCVF